MHVINVCVQSVSSKNMVYLFLVRKLFLMRWFLESFYALPMFYNYLTEHSKNQIRALFKKAKRWQLVHTDYYLDSLAEKSMFSLFKQSTSELHALNHLYTCNRNERFSTLRRRGHNCITPAFKYDITFKNFILYCLNYYCYLP
jgi:hypothetical protein